MVVARVELPTALSSNSLVKAVLALEDGTILHGQGFGYPCRVTGEVVFNTGLVGYVESLTDPSYYGQILVQTYPLIGNYGVPSDGLSSLERFESDRVQVRGYAISDLCENPSHWSSSKTLHHWLRNQGTPGIAGIDTRQLTRKLRVEGTMLGILQVSVSEPDAERLSRDLRQLEDPNRENLVRQVSVDSPVIYGKDSADVVALIDCGVKYGILRNLLKRGFRVIRLPYNSSASDVFDYHPKGVVVSNGPGDPKLCQRAIETVRELIDSRIPILGICLGLQLVALAEGADTYKMKYGHRGQNHPCVDIHSGRAWITSQNHGYAVEEESLNETQLEVSLKHANDGTIEGVRHRSYPVRAVQFHPEASPGPTEAGVVFDEFAGDVLRYRD